jgi:N-carbamoyl-L-amino-acid hydrolase
MNPLVDQDRLFQELKTLATFSEPAAEGAERPGDTAVTRVVFTERDREARAWLDGLAQAAGLTIRTDAVGNTFFRWQGSEPELPAVATGSHIDAIPNAGMYDGTVGVLGGLEAIRALQAAGFAPKRSIELILFTSEEPTRFGIGCLGSRLMSGVLAVHDAQTLRDKSDGTLDEARLAAGFSGALDSVRCEPHGYSRFVELHIEQGPLLERDGIEIGVVAHIAAPSGGWITIEGEGGHAGALLMPSRRDALAAAAEVIVAVEAAALGTHSIDTVATVGICDVFPGAVNSVPSRVRLSYDVRDTDRQRRDFVLGKIEEACEEIAARRRVTITSKTLNADPPATCDATILEAIQAACAAEGASSQRMVSRAYHDSSFMSRLCPVAMIFIPCRKGVSHRPDEFAKAEDIARGTRVLARTLAALSEL